QVLEAAVEVVDAVDDGLAARRQTGDDQAGRGAQVGGHDLGAAEFGNPLYAGFAAADRDLGPKAPQFRHVHEAVLEDGLANNAFGVGQGHQGHEVGLQVGGETGIDIGGDVDGLEAALAALDGHGGVAARHFAAGLDQLVEQDRNQLRPHLGQADLAAGHRG